MALVLFGTLDQVHWGIWQVQQSYFGAWFAVWPIDADGAFPRWCLPLPGGFTLGVLLFVNLVCAHVRFFRLRWGLAGIAFIHAGVLLLIVGAFFTALWQEDFQMEIPEGQSRDVIIESLGDAQKVAAVQREPERRTLPFALHLDKFTHEYYPGTTTPKNFASAIRIIEKKTGAAGAAQEDKGRPVTISMNNPLRHEGYAFYQSSYRTGNAEQSTATILQVVRNPGRWLPYISILFISIGMLIQFLTSLAKWIASTHARKAVPPPTALLLPFALLAAGTPATFASAETSAATAAAAATGETAAEIFSGLPVQYNGRVQPIDTLARNTLLILRGKQNVGFTHAEAVALGKRPSTWSDADKKLLAAENIVIDEHTRALLEKQPVALSKKIVGRDYATLDAISWLMELSFRPAVAAYFPVFRIENDEVRTLIQRKKSGAVAHFSWNDLVESRDAVYGKIEAVLAKRPDERSAFDRGVVKLHDAVNACHAVRTAFVPGDLPTDTSPLDEYVNWVATLKQAAAAHDATMKAPGATIFDPRLQDRVRALLNRYREMQSNGAVGITPPRTEEDKRANHWENLGSTLLGVIQNRQLDSPPVVLLYAELFSAQQNNDAAAAVQAAGKLREIYKDAPGASARKLALEKKFNRIEPFFKSLCLYGVLFLLVCLGWALGSRRIYTLAAWGIVGVFALHTAALLARMWIQGRPPVTNLYSSAVFVAWGAVLLGIIVERFVKNGIGSAAAAVTGFGSLIIAHNISLGGDTLQMMRAVLDSNFWLATHVVTITLGYSAMFVAGLVAALWIILRNIGRAPDGGVATERVVYGVICFGVLMSFIGTMIGGVWADQSWGRFWGWDPKENGALLVVLWGAIFLHVRRGKLVGIIGRMQLAIIGNVVTAASWFGTNLLGVGLHSYGFSDGGFSWLCAFWASQLFLFALAWRIHVPNSPKTSQQPANEALP
ncbi:MAG: cytochrome c biogenesis protein ResB [Puniceicoccales bacterium]|nr:cytochrome c biogenesis protein ResB [Puniceicoccales bacterium]